MDWYRLLPPYWVQNRRTCLHWDKALSEALDDGIVHRFSARGVRVGNLNVWVSNWPHAYGSKYMLGVLPKVSTRKRLREAVARHDAAGLDHDPL